MLTSTLPYLSLKSVNVLLSFTCFFLSENASTSPLAHLFARGSQTSTSSFPYPSVGVNISTATFLPVCMGRSENINIQFPLLLCRVNLSTSTLSYLSVWGGQRTSTSGFPYPSVGVNLSTSTLSYLSVWGGQRTSTSSFPYLSAGGQSVNTHFPIRP